LPDDLIDLGSFLGCTNLREITIPEGIRSIESFRGCSNLEKITIPKNVHTINYGTFENCTKLKEVVFEGTTYQDQEGQDVELPDYTFNNSDIGDITNLLSLF
jgi:hypothetical protein